MRDITKTYVSAEWQLPSPLIACRFDPKGRFAFATCEDNSVQRVDLATGGLTPLGGHDSWVHAMAFSSDGETLVTGGCDGRLIWRSVAGDPAPLRTVQAHQGWIRAMDRSPDGQHLATAANDRVVRVWNLADGSLVKELVGCESHIYSVLHHPAGQFLLTGELRGQIRQWDLATGAQARSFDGKALWSFNGGQLVDFGGVRSLAISPDGKHLACGGLHNASNPLGAVHDPLVLLYDWESQTLVQSLVAEPLKGSIWRVLYLSDGTLVGVTGGTTGGHLCFWNAAQNKDLHRVQLPNIARDVDLHPDGVQLLTSHHDRKLRLSRMEPKPA